MTDLATHQLPTLDRLGVSDPGDGVSASSIAQAWLNQFTTALASSSPSDAVANLFIEDGFWKDVLALTWDFRTFGGHASIKRLLDARLAPVGGLNNVKLIEDDLRKPEVQRMFPDLVLLRLLFTFETNVGKGTAIVNLVPTKGGEWKAYMLLTHLDGLKDYPEQVGELRNQKAAHGTWEAKRAAESEFKNNDPTIVIVGAGHTGLEIAARLKYLGVRALVIEKNGRVGDSWRNRYKALCLHDTVWYNTMPYLPFPATWPVFSPAGKLADWLEDYADMLELPVWTSSLINSTAWDDSKKTWTIEVTRGSESEKRVLNAKHLVFATGFSGKPKLPSVPGQDKFKGEITHSTNFTSAANYVGKKAVVVGACNSGHDVAQDFLNHSVNVTMYQRSSTLVVSSNVVRMVLASYKEGYPVELADVLGEAFPYPPLVRLQQRVTPYLMNNVDKELIEGLNKVGFKTNMGPMDAGLFPLLFERAGGYYLDTGTSKHIISGEIKLKNGSEIAGYTEKGLKLEDGTELEADIIVYGTGYGDPRDVMHDICPPEVASKVHKVWGLDNEGNLSGIWRPCGQENMWFGVGNLALSRFHSLHLALQIKAIEEGLVKWDEVKL
ncbi:FAD/NAD(P)-binding domain-containing protein [Coniophora puteana RWD-64-598 SS2]|uniref:FAD/NAD(P)-binding domain-containing protein n=1 Tax=Coniophora puteana (strain RWD-64-598) TaxID=741705 RepID=A0A5M3MWC9_CONPW|nr:FAD/NAD(P)-binding domain-containing protein [Coniophora puteana RWD-64-598 SS2]EIW83472.1 FAD/NAD(P)-binding domain-containing protein [Coniophora puteana RWD-64-598 SS2]